MSEPEAYDVIALGCGAGTKNLAPSLAQGGKRVALIERQYVGGACPNVACLPSKNIIRSAEVAHLAALGARYGVGPVAPPVDMASVRTRKRAMVDDLIGIYRRRFDEAGVDFIWGEGRFVDSHIIEVRSGSGIRRLRADTIVVNTGSRAAMPPIPGLAEAQPLTHVEALELDVVPDHLVIMGAGYVALEFAQAYRRFGSRVTVIGRGADLLPSEDGEVGACLRQVLEDEGIEFLLAATIDSVTGESGRRVAVTVSREGERIEVAASHLMVALGRTPNTDDIGVEASGIQLRDDATIRVDERLATNVPGIFALGDCAGSPNFTYIAFDDFFVLADRLNGGDRTTTGRQVPFCLFTDPEYARVGMTEREAVAGGVAHAVLKLPMAVVGRAQTLGETRGFIKALVDPTGCILGFAALASGAGELLTPIQIAMKANLPYTAFRETIIAHPTMAEALKVLFLQTAKSSTD